MRGRPKLPDGADRASFISVRVTDTEKRWLKDQAKRLSKALGRTITMSSIAHRLIAIEMRNEETQSSAHR